MLLRRTLVLIVPLPIILENHTVLVRLLQKGNELLVFLILDFVQTSNCSGLSFNNLQLYKCFLVSACSFATNEEDAIILTQGTSPSSGRSQAYLHRPVQ